MHLAAKNKTEKMQKQIEIAYKQSRTVARQERLLLCCTDTFGLQNTVPLTAALTGA